MTRAHLSVWRAAPRLAAVLVAAAAAALAAVPRVAHALVPGAPTIPGIYDPTISVKTDTKVRVVLDPRLYALIEGLPEDLRDNALKFLAEALPLVRDNLVQFLQEADRIVAVRLNDAQCRLPAVARRISEEAAAGLTGTDRVLRVREYADEFRYRDRLRSPFSARDTTTLINDYADHLEKMSTHLCGLNATEAVQTYTDSRTQAAIHWQLWRSLQGRCATIKACITLRQSELEDLVARADGRDVAHAQAERLIEEARNIDWTLPGSLGLRRTSIIASEELLLRLRTAEDGINTARATRQAAARGMLDGALAEIAEAKKALDGAKAKAERPWRGEPHLQRGAMLMEAKAAAHAQLARLVRQETPLAASAGVDAGLAADVEQASNDATQTRKLAWEVVDRASGAHKALIANIDQHIQQLEADIRAASHLGSTGLVAVATLRRQLKQAVTTRCQLVEQAT